jgi:hypothetical protein
LTEDRHGEEVVQARGGSGLEKSLLDLKQVFMLLRYF